MTGPDYYQILEIPKKATAREIRRAYRRLVRKYHPDLNPADELAAHNLRAVQKAYEVLGDSRKRKAYDYYGPDFGERVPTRDANEKRPPSAPIPRSPSDSSRHTSRGYSTTVWSGRAWAHAVTALGGRVVFAVVFLGGAFLYFLWPDARVREFKLAGEALRQVKSWKMEIRKSGSGLSAPEYLDEASCLSNERVTHHVLKEIDGHPTDLTLGTLSIGNKHYYYDVHAARWMRDSTGGTGPTDPCARLSRWFPFDEWLAKAYAIEEQGVRETPDGRCREWKIVTLGAPSSAQFVCLGLRDHLPRFQGAPGGPGEARFYDWNAPIDFQPPDLVVSGHDGQR